MPPNVLPVTHRFNSSAARPADYLDLPDRPHSLVSFSAIERTGTVPVDGLLSTLTGQDLSVDLHAQDAYVQALNQIITQAQHKLQANPEIAALLTKPTWDKSDRIIWEKSLSDMVAQEMHAVHSLDTYRTESSSGQSNSVKRDPLVNALARDITSSGQSVMEFDCEQMSLTVGLAMQKVEQALLPAASNGDAFREEHNYYYAAGMMHTVPMTDGEKPTAARGHAIIVSSATGHFIEAANSKPDRFTPGYREITTPGYDFSTFLQTGTAVLDAGSVFADSNDPQKARKARDNDTLISWCVRRLSDRPTLPPDCNKPVVTTALQKLPKY